MNRFPSPLLFAIVFLLFVTSAAAQCSLSNSTNCAYITNLTGQQVLAVDRTATSAVPFVVRTLSNGELAEEATVGPDNKLYVSLPTNNLIIRMDLNGANRETVYDKGATSGPPAPIGLRFSAQGDLFFGTKGATPAGIFRIPGVANVATGGTFSQPTLVFSSSTATEGLGVAPNGDLYVAQPTTGKIVRIAAPGYTTSSDLVTGLASPVGLAVNTDGKIFVAEQGAGSVARCGVNGSCTTYVAFDAPDVPYHVEVTLDKALFVATGDPSQNGKLWRVTAANTKFLVATLPQVKGKIPPAVGLAVPSSSRTNPGVLDADIHKQTFDFGSFRMEVTNPGLGIGKCSLNVTAAQRSPSLLKTIIKNSLPNTNLPIPIQFDGQQGWDIGLTIVPDLSCSLADDSDVFIAALFTPPSGTVFNPRGIKMPNGCSASSTCSQALLLTLDGYYSTGPLELFPTDPGVGNKPRGYSEFALVTLPITTGVAQFCGFLPPLNPNGSRSVNSGQNVTIKFQLADNCSSANPNFVPDAQTTLSVSRINSVPNSNSLATAVFERKLIDASGNSVPVPPTFKYDAGTNQYIFTFSTKNGFPVGTYEIDVTSDNRFFPQKVQFNIVK